MSSIELVFLGTGGAWGVPELNCDCLICRQMRQEGEKRERPALVLSKRSNLLIDCGPDIAGQLSRHSIPKPDAVLITHEHGDHYLGLDELFSYKRSCPRGKFQPIPVYLTAKSWGVIRTRFGYLEDMEVINVHLVEPRISYTVEEFEFVPFKTDHGPFAAGSVGYVVKTEDECGEEIRMVYTSDFVNLPESIPELNCPDYLIIQSFWLNEPTRNAPHHMSFQRALAFIKAWRPKKETFLVHIGDGDRVPGDPANRMLKKRKSVNPMRSPKDGAVYPVPLNQAQWQETTDRIMSQRNLPFKITVAYDDLKVHL